jgi:hypothetical protein
MMLKGDNPKVARLFLSLAFDEFGQKISVSVKEQLTHFGVECVMAGEMARDPPPEAVRSLILTCDALLAIITHNRRDWIQNEIGIAYAAKLPVYGLVEEGTEVEGILPRITSYVRFSRSLWEFVIPREAAIIANEMRGTEGVRVMVTPTRMLVGSTGRLHLLLKPRKIPRGEEIITISIPRGFYLTQTEVHVELDKLSPLSPRLFTTKEIPDSKCSISLTPKTTSSSFEMQIVLIFPEVESYLHAGWVEFQLQCTVPSIAGRYLFVGRDQVLVSGGNARDASSFESNPISITGEVSRLSLVGRIFTSPNVPLAKTGIVRAKMTTRLDPYTGQTRPDLPTIDAVGYIGANDDGKYEVPGLASGIFDIYASAWNSAETLIAHDLKIFKQPESLDGQITL